MAIDAAAATVAAPARRRAAQRDDRLAYLDQAMYLGLRATGQAAVMQCVWIYEHPVDLDGLERFGRNFGHGLAGRRIERSALPFGRHRWVASPGVAPGIDVAESPRPRAELGDWIDERAVLPVDPEWGPGWHLGVLPMTDGSTAVSLVGSHCLGDGGGALLTVLSAATGNVYDFGYPPPGSRTRREALAQDARQLIRDLPEVGRTLAAAGKLARRNRTAGKAPKDRRTKRAVHLDNTRHVAVPAVTAFLDIADWDARASALGGNTYSLLAGFAARLAEAMGRTGAEGKVPLIVPINDRADLDDTRANAVKLANVRIDPSDVTRDLSRARAELKRSLAALGDEPDGALQLLPLVPFLPRRAVKAAAESAFGFADHPVSCSNLGDLPAEIGRADGTDAEYVFMRGVDQHITLRVLEQRHGLLTVVGARINGRISIAVVGYQAGAPNSKAGLRRLVEHTLSEFGLDGVVF
ncbi:hypothetical protein H7I41_17245 [Mycobacterium manitobense]|uniref:Diacylglycerol O-acyltransferase n=1 Tax=[Mycobacterium] manitobense TaxID=190147 RepID=A0A9X2YR08_9MYCO|nr:hypothetical protein [[Mycobacterium] manitobense]MCV7171664.1 hypothetical protein [[Mycobacterium] manitobense]